MAHFTASSPAGPAMPNRKKKGASKNMAEGAAKVEEFRVERVTHIYKYFSSDCSGYSATIFLRQKRAIRGDRVEEHAPVVEYLSHAGMTDLHGSWKVESDEFEDRLLIDFNCKEGTRAPQRKEEEIPRLRHPGGATR